MILTVVQTPASFSFFNASKRLFAEGSEVKEGQPLYALESDKSVQEIEAPATGTLKILAQAGEIYKVGDVLGEIV